MTTDWLKVLAPHDRENEIVAMAMFAALGLPRRYLDVGCGTGAMVNLARKLGVEAIGVDQLKRGEDYFIQHDLSLPLRLGWTDFDLVTCLEVVEHIPSEFETFVLDTLAYHLRPEGLLVFTSALPGQHGEEHVNFRTPEYWRNRLYERGLYLKTELTWRLALMWSTANHSLMWLPANLQVFAKAGPPPMEQGT